LQLNTIIITFSLTKEKAVLLQWPIGHNVMESSRHVND
jgi:hypothetical protein